MGLTNTMHVLCLGGKNFEMALNPKIIFGLTLHTQSTLQLFHLKVNVLNLNDGLYTLKLDFLSAEEAEC